MTRGLAWFAVAALFIAGIVIGVLGTLLFAGGFLHPPPPPRGPIGGPPGIGGPPDRMHLDRLARQLELSGDQRARIEAILTEVHLESTSLRDELRPRLESLMGRTDDRIRAELDPSQREAFDELRERHRGMMERFFVGGRDRPPPRGGRRRPGPPPRRP